MADEWKSYVDLDGTHVLAPANAPTTIDGLMERMGLHEAQILRNAAGTEVYSVIELLATAWQMADFGARSDLVPRITHLQARLDQIHAVLDAYYDAETDVGTEANVVARISAIVDKPPPAPVCHCTGDTHVITCPDQRGAPGG